MALSSLLPLALLTLALPAAAQEHSLERPLPAGSALRLKLSAGEYRIRAGAQGDRLRITWNREARVEFSQEGKGALLRVKGPRNNFRVDIEVPARLDLDIDQSIGEVDIAGVQGSKRIDLNIGEVRIQVPDPGEYRQVQACLKIGEIRATPFGLHREGFFRDCTWSGGGAFSMDIRLGIGEVHLLP